MAIAYIMVPIVLTLGSTLHRRGLRANLKKFHLAKMHSFSNTSKYNSRNIGDVFT